ncbi:MAG: hypothetical protein IKW85_10420 [Muribaculaceae bacterium]|nr:hypothetical protein [Muribaculaceae bacterium]
MKRSFIMVAIAALQLTSLPAVAIAQQVELPNYVKVLGLKDGVKYSFGAYTDNDEIFDYCSYEFNLAGNLVSYGQGETIEGAYSWTAFFDAEGLPTYVETVFIDYWSDPDANGNPPVTTTRYNVKKEQNGRVTKIIIEDFEEEGLQANVTRDDKGRIIEVDNLTKGEVCRYRYPDDGNVPYRYNGILAFPQVDMFAGHQIEFPTPQNIPDNPDTFTYGTWHFEVFSDQDN